MNQQSSRIYMKHRTSMPPGEVLAWAKRFFADSVSIYAVFFEKEGPNHVVLRGQGGEELIVATEAIAGGTLVSGGTYMFDAQLQRFFAALPPWVEPAEPAALPESTELPVEVEQ